MPRSHVARRIRHRLGYRGLALTMFGIIYILIGFGVLANPMRNPVLLHTHLPVGVRMAIWIGSGLLAILGAVQPGLGAPHWPGKTIRPPVAQIIGFASLAFGPVERAISYAIGMALQPTWVWLNAFAVWTLLALLIFLLSRWPEPTEPQIVAVQVVENA